jgi:heme oxygenase
MKDRRMNDRKGRRETLRRATGAAHKTLEAGIGDLADYSNYRNYVAGLLAFRAVAEPYVAAWRRPGHWGDWQPTRIATDLAVDAIALDVQPRIVRWPAEPDNAAQAIGFLYVLEGSALGARVLLRNREALPPGERGLRHLQRQAGSLDNWRAFVDRLETEPDLDVDETARSASLAFELAAQAMRGLA